MDTLSWKWSVPLKKCLAGLCLIGKHTIHKYNTKNLIQINTIQINTMRINAIQINAIQTLIMFFSLYIIRLFFIIQHFISRQRTEWRTYYIEWTIIIPAIWTNITGNYNLAWLTGGLEMWLAATRAVSWPPASWDGGQNSHSRICVSITMSLNFVSYD